MRECAFAEAGAARETRSGGRGPPVLALLALCGSFAVPARLDAQPSAPPDEDEDFFGLTLEELVQTKVTSVAGYADDWFTTPAALTVVTGEQLRRSGHTHLIEALRLVPGVHVGRIDSRQWAIGVRGFSDLFQADLQVVVDGRSIYNDLFGGVFWDVQDLLLEDVERIEVVRGPGATLWGANAVKGVVNVITRRASRTQGTVVTGGGGTEERGFAGARHGGELGAGHYRVWGRYSQRDNTERQFDGRKTPDDWNLGSAGLRLDVPLDAGPVFTLDAQGHYTDRLGQSIRGFPTVRGNGSSDGGHALFRLHRNPEPEAGARSSAEAMSSFGSAHSLGWTAQTYYDFEHRRSPDGFGDERHTFDLDLRARGRIGAHHELIGGAGYRYRHTRLDASPSLAFPSSPFDTHLVTGFVQDRIAFFDGRVVVLGGSKFEHNDFSGFEAQPSIRLSYLPTGGVTLWGAVSRPVRTPTLVEEEIAFEGFPGIVLNGRGSLEAERLVSYEVGLRLRGAHGDFDGVESSSPREPAWTLDVAAFFDDHEDLIVTGPGTPPTDFLQETSAWVYGVEIAATWRPLSWWRWESSYSFLEVDAKNDFRGNFETRSPAHQLQLHSQLDVCAGIQLDASLYYVDRVTSFLGATPPVAIPAYVRLDLGVTWRPRPGVELSLVGQNLAEEHVEYFQALRVETPNVIERGVYGKATLRF